MNKMQESFARSAGSRNYYIADYYKFGDLLENAEQYKNRSLHQNNMNSGGRMHESGLARMINVSKK